MCKTVTEAAADVTGGNIGSPERASLASVVGRVAHTIGRILSPGDVAELRRLAPWDPSSPAFFKLLASTVEPNLELPVDGPSRTAVERRWAAVFQAAATLTGLHQPKRGLGEALQSAGYSELRLVRLLRAQGEVLFKELRTCAHFLATKAESSNLVDLARLALITNVEKAENLRRSIARGYYRRRANDQKES